MLRRLITIIAAGSAVIALFSTVMWVRGFFVSDIWVSHLFTPAARTLDSRSVEVSGGWVMVLLHSVGGVRLWLVVALSWLLPGVRV
jgi:hypothetical protein